MRGRHVFMQSLEKHAVRHIFGNPGTTESPLIDSLPEYPGIDYIVALHEGVALGAASFYAQATGRTGVVNLHVAPGLGNALGMLYSALKAGSPMVVTAGQQDTRMRLRDPLLGHDLVAMAAPVTKWSVQAERADELGPLLRRAFKIANDPPAGPVFVALPIDVMEQETSVAAIGPGTLYRATRPDPEGVADVARLLLASRNPVIVAGDDVARAAATDRLVALAERVGAPVWVEGLRAHLAFPAAHAHARGAVPFDAATIRKALDGADLVLLAGGPFFEEVWYAAGDPFPDGAAVIQLEESHTRLAFNFAPQAGLVGRMDHLLQAVDDAVAAGADDGYRAAAMRRGAALKTAKEADAAAYRARVEKAWSRMPISMPRALAEIRAGLPADAVVVDESITANIDLARAFDFTRPGDYYSGRGGGIGQGLAGVLGVKLAHPDRPVVAISGDGSAMYSIQALWTAAHHALPIVFVILANREYRVLKHNLDVYRQRFGELANHPYPHMDLTGPALGFVDMARGMGVAGTLVTKPDDVRGAIAQAVASGKPHLVEIAIEGKR
ncbi:thiamine pyrophosphate-binding protein [Vineibacter terrae]|uniref:Thiamine pyrophosphate-binding protein n=1 Tax=Vineibacter terrae TaxID=2586908 RepID=A0A5C8PF57_9HYPH|nr:thiamine pyrophosphate-binding protein [Vineibacter terrae]TXL72287.1 thiamine pyrophosphate-binding protein [Vineibacter terrae]